MTSKSALFTLFCLCGTLLFGTGCGDTLSDVVMDGESSLPDTVESAASVTGGQTGTITTTQPLTPLSEETALITANNFEVYEKVKVSDIISKEFTALHPDELIDTSDTGSKKMIIEYSDGDKQCRSEVSYTVSDTTAPLTLHSGDGSQILCGETFDINDCVGVADNFDRKVSITYTGTVDTSVCGSYPISVMAADHSGNKTEWDITVKVVSEKKHSEPPDTHTYFYDFRKTYGGAGVSLGIDVSRWQNDIDFEAVKAAGCEFVIMRIGYYDYEYTLDSCFVRNMAGAKQAGLKTGVYMYTMANTEQEIKENVKWINDTLGGEKLDLPVVFDWEEFYNFQQYEMSIHDLNEYFRLFAEETEKYGYKAMLYSSKNYLNDFWYEQTDYPVWLAHYTDETDYSGEYAVWQMCSDGKIDGIAGDVDLNVMYNDKMKQFN